MGPISEADEAALERSIVELHPLDVAAATSVLLEVKQVLDELGVVFYLEEGTCLGAIREHGIIPWDDDVDLASVFGLHGLTEKAVDGIVAKFREHGFVTKIVHRSHAIYVPALKSGTRVDWHGRWIVDGSTFHYPGVRIPAGLFTDLKEIDFLGEKFHVPNPPEDFLRMKYGPDWMTPKPAAYVEDVVRMIPEVSIPYRGSRLRRLPHDPPHALARHQTQGARPRGPAGLPSGGGGGRNEPFPHQRAGIRQVPRAGRLVLCRCGQVPRPRGGALRRAASSGRDVRLYTGPRRGTGPALRPVPGIRAHGIHLACARRSQRSRSPLDRVRPS